MDRTAARSWKTVADRAVIGQPSTAFPTPGRYTVQVNYLIVGNDGTLSLELQLRPSGHVVTLQVEEVVTPQAQAKVACRIIAIKALHTKFVGGAVIEYIQARETEFGENYWTRYFSEDVGVDAFVLFGDAREWIKEWAEG